MRAVLTAFAQLCTLQAVAEVAFWEPRPEFHYLCREAEAGRTLDAKTLAELVPGLSETGGRNLAAHLVYIGLADREGRLTPLGKSCAKTGLAPIWEFGAYDFLIVNHPLFGSVFLDIQRRAPNSNDNDFNSFTNLPISLPDDRYRIFVSVYNASSRFSVYGVEASEARESCRCGQLQDAVLTVTVSNPLTGLGEWRVEGHGGARGSFKSDPEPLPLGLFAGMMGSLDPRWKPVAKRLTMAFDGEVDPTGHNQFRRPWYSENVSIRLSGKNTDVAFSKAEVEDVPVEPSSQDEAKKWAVAVVSTRLAQSNRYVTNNEWSQLWRDEIATSPLASWLNEALTLRDALELRGVDIPPRTRWLLSAAMDLAVE